MTTYTLDGHYAFGPPNESTIYYSGNTLDFKPNEKRYLRLPVPCNVTTQKMEDQLTECLADHRFTLLSVTPDKGGSGIWLEVELYLHDVHTLDVTQIRVGISDSELVQIGERQGTINT